MSRSVLLIIVLTLLGIALFGWMNVIELRAEEPRRAIVSLEMLLSGNWVLPQINGWPYYNKPPVFNWIMAAFFAIFGSADEWVVRLPSLLSFILLAGFHYLFSRRYLGREVAMLSSLFLLTSADILMYGSVNSGEIDLFYALLVYLQVIVIFWGFQHKKFLMMFLLSYLFMSLGFLTKGLPSLAFQAITLLVTALWYHRFWILLGWKHFSGILLFLLICGGYFYLYDQQDDAVAFLVRQFKEASQRTGLETPLTETLIQTLTFPLQMATLLLPWSLLLLFFFRKNFIRNIGQNAFITFSSLFIASNIIIYWISGDFKPRYYYMFFPFICSLLAFFYVRGKDNLPLFRRIFHIFAGIFTVILVLIFPTLFAVPEVSGLPNAGIKIIIMLVLSLLAALAFFKLRYKLLCLALAMVVARLGLNLLYLPALQEHNDGMYYRDVMAEVIQITGDEPVYLYGEPHLFSSDASLGPITLNEVELTTAPLIAYQIPYYISSKNRHILYFDPQLSEGKFYIAPKDMVSDHEALYTFEDKWKNRVMVLIRT